MSLHDRAKEHKETITYLIWHDDPFMAQEPFTGTPKVFTLPHIVL